jgi:hypothetical protein
MSHRLFRGFDSGFNFLLLFRFEFRELSLGLLKSLGTSPEFGLKIAYLKFGGSPESCRANENVKKLTHMSV